MGKWSGAQWTDRDVAGVTQADIRLIVRRVVNGEIDPPDGTRQLVDLVWKAANALARVQQAREGADI